MRSLLVSLTSPATLECLKFEIVFELGASIITHPTGSRLQKVDVDIKYCFRYDGPHLTALKSLNLSLINP